MSLRELGQSIGGWLSNLGQGLIDGLTVAFTQSFWDWPLWISIPVAIGVPWALMWLYAWVANELARGVKDGLGWTLTFGALAAFSGYTAFDVFFGDNVYERASDQRFEGGVALIFALGLGAYFVISVIKHVRSTREGTE